MAISTPGSRHERGQVLVLVVLAIVGLLAMTGLVVDGGNTWAQQRQTQNASDSAAEAGAVILAQWYKGATAPSTSYSGTCPTVSANTWDAAVCRAVYGAGSYNGVTVTSAYYTNFDGSVNLGNVGGGALPSDAQGIRALGRKVFDTYFARVVPGMNQFSAGADATAVVGTIKTYCPPGAICGTLPVTFPVQTALCAGNGTLQVGSGAWPVTTTFVDTSESIVPLCKNGPGSVGWLQWPCATQNGTPGLISEISSPCNVNITLPEWIDTSTGNTNDGAVEAALNVYHGKLVWLPQFTDTRGTGNNLQYFVTQFQAFQFDTAYIAGNNHPACNSAPGHPFVDGNGSNGCIKGWWTGALVTGSVQIGDITQGTNQTLGVQLIR